MPPPLARRLQLPVHDRRFRIGRTLRQGIVVVSIALLGVFAVARPASAHGGDESQEGYLLVQQALGHLAHDTTPTGIDLALEKVDDALAAPDQDGVAVADVTRAKSALEQGSVAQARTLLEGSITAALSELGPATGEDTATTVVPSELLGRTGLTGRDWLFLGGSLVLLLAGVALAFWFRPHDSVRELRQRLTPPGALLGQTQASAGDDE